MDTQNNTASTAQVEVKRISKRDLTIAYQIDRKSSYELAEQYGITHDEMKAAIRTAGLVVRKNEIKGVDQAPTYQVALVDANNVEEIVKC